MLSGSFVVQDLIDINLRTSKTSILDDFTKELYFFNRTNGRDSLHTPNLSFEAKSPPSNEGGRLRVASGI